MTGGYIPRRHDNVTVMFTDFIHFTKVAELLPPEELVAELHEYFQEFDRITAKHGIEKIKTMGDSYMAAGGLPVATPSHAIDVVKAALEIQEYMEEQKLRKQEEGKIVFEVRIGIHSGPVVAGIVGSRKFAYDIWGDTVNTASRLESSGNEGRVNISGATYELVKDQFTCEYRGKVPAKHKGIVDMYFVDEAQ